MASFKGEGKAETQRALEGEMQLEGPREKLFLLHDLSASVLFHLDPRAEISNLIFSFLSSPKSLQNTEAAGLHG